MDAKTNIESRLPSRHVTEGSEPAPRRSYPDAMGLTTRQVAALDCPENAALHLQPIAHACATNSDLFGATEIFKKTSCAAGLKPAGRYVAKDMPEVDVIPLLMKTLLDRGTLNGDPLTVESRTIAENLKTVKWHSHQDVAHSADKPITFIGGVAGLKGNLSLKGATGADERFLDVKLTDEELAERKTKREPRATNHTSGALWKYAQHVGPAVDGAVTRPGGGHEKQCYADI